MEICPRCKKSRPVKEILERDPKTNKRWLITRCSACSFNFDLEDWAKYAARIKKEIL